MSTNYYIRTLDRDDVITNREEHIGRHAAGWRFMFQGSNYTSVKEWVNRLNNLGRNEVIVDETGRILNLLEMFSIIEATRGDKFESSSWSDDGFGFRSYEFS